jgi:uncharacterized protein
MDSDEVASFLQKNPEFFEEYADLLTNVLVPSPHGGQAIPISERQVLSLREGNRLLEAKLRELIEFGEKNDTISDRLHKFTIDTIRARDLGSSTLALYSSLRDDFSIATYALKLWGGTHSLPEFQGVSEEARGFAESLTMPYCSSRAMLDTSTWFGGGEDKLQSFAYVALRNNQVFGLLALASEDAHRFYPEMGTLYLKRLGEITGAGMARYL